MIWEMSLTAFDKPREVQVVVDDDDCLHMSFGTPGFVDFDTPPIGMKLPIRSWIHTHPFGQAYFSGTDWKTIKTWQLVMNEAIVLGDNEYMVWEKGIQHTVFFRKEPILDFNQTILEDWVKTTQNIQTTLDIGEEE